MQLATDKRLAHDASGTLIAAKSLPVAVSRTPEQLEDIVSLFAASDEWLDRVRLRAERRWYERLYHDQDYDIWVISWMPGQSTGFHDHGASSGAFVVATGTLEEHRVGERSHVIYPGKPRAFGPDYAHDVRNISLAPAISIHAYSPPLDEMNEYELDGSRLVPRERVSENAETLDQEWPVRRRKPVGRTGASSIEQVLSAARARLQRLSPDEAYRAMIKPEAILVDIRPEGQRAIEGSIAGALVVERNVLEWRFDPASSARLPVASNHDLQIIVFCSEGYTSSLAAASLQDLGLWSATDIVGGFHAWRAAGLPTVPPAEPSKIHPAHER
ncbi:rhodanese-like domain-containing protein [Tunturiibacter gelidoferens]|uniref:Rhodanese-related sulfurtransferase/mannose-6-phosphate isomerase-like protein (Cupin superfamily) n=1 Tax=Tunturiibacter gelidiferens TaxID=3069689 RepID=A0ACC5NW94_9BACT|nr:rhodanese-like domain-containing protein [Edaphobacter lichenicola]MBB5338832.1 rhodanese-related sulfurtransferase/mannose-6-phosphate isomerase-like protein (cupin superfamily) [Edaphobacter lichenicola]